MVPVVSVMVPFMVIVPILFIMNLSQVATVCRIDLYGRRLWHSLAWRRHPKNQTSRNGRGYGQYFDAEHDEILLSLRTHAP